MTTLTRQDGNTDLWRTVFADGHPVLVTKQKRYRMLPSDPRCKLCEMPFGGVGGWFFRQRGLKASDRNPHYCTTCDGFLEAFPGGAEVPMSMMMVDIRDSVALSGQISPTDFARLVMALRDDMARILDQTDGFLLEFQGDSVFAVWPPGFVGPSHAQKALRAAELAQQMFASRKDRKAAPVGVAVHTGPVYIGTVSGAGGRLQGISAFGLEVNILARLAAAARPGEVLVSAAAYAAANTPMPVGHHRSEVLKGVDHPVEVAVL
ncbi:MAG: adenylate/guanylate cyclase domain-containing protein [Paracoccaceae bacterium]